MYRRRQSSSFLTIIALGMFLGVGFLLYQQWRNPAPLVAPAPTFTPSPPPTATPEPVIIPSTTPRPRASIFIPTAGITASVIEVYLDGESWDVEYLGMNAGHLQGTAWFGDTGNMVLAGHVEMPDGRAGIFAGINELNVGDPLIVSLNDSQRRYSVTVVKKVAPDDLSVLYPTDHDQITLITCDSYNFFENEYQDRVVVVAERIA
jgi:LPXTG-site transpeptidase (sortase) family protein